MITIYYKYYSKRLSKSSTLGLYFHHVENAIRFCYEIKDNKLYSLDRWTTTTKEEEEEMNRRVSVLFQKKGGSK